MALGTLPPETFITHVVRSMPTPFHGWNAEGVVFAKICNLPMKDRLAVNLLNPQATVLTLDLQVVAVRSTRGGKPVPTSIP